MADTWIIPGGPAIQENEDGAAWLVPGVAIINEKTAAVEGWTGEIIGIINPSEILGRATSGISEVNGVS